MTFGSIDALKSYILTKNYNAIKIAQERIYLIINRFVKEYYSEFDPTFYERTYQLFRSLVKTNVVMSGDKVVAEVYFDLDALDYHMKKINGVEVPNKNWSEEKTLHEAMVGGTHGGYKAPKNTEIWNESLSVLKREAYHILKKSLIDAGVPVK